MTGAVAAVLHGNIARTRWNFFLKRDRLPSCFPQEEVWIIKKVFKYLGENWSAGVIVKNDPQASPGMKGRR